MCTANGQERKAESVGTMVRRGQPFKQGLRQIAQAHRQLSRKLQGSQNRKKANHYVAHVHRRVRHVRQAFHWHLARALCTQYDHITLETLNLQGMKALWGRKVSDLGFGTFVDILHYVAAKVGTIIHHIDPWFPSTKLCSVCGQVNHHITLRDRLWTCERCGTTHRRDQNAATNIFRERLRPAPTQSRQGASSRGGGHVSLAPVSNG
jgi:putative transposase